MNADESEKCLLLSKEFFEQQQVDKALKFAEKAHRMNPTSISEAWLNKLKGSGSSSNKSTHKQPESSETENYSQKDCLAIKEFWKRCTDQNDFYQILSVAADATETDIKKAYKKLALMFHPDKNHAPGATEIFKLVSKAFSILSNSTKRAQYDTSRKMGHHYDENSSSAFHSHGHNPYSTYFHAQPRSRFTHDYFDDSYEFDPNEIFNMFFNGHRSMFDNTSFFMSNSVPFGRTQHSFRGNSQRRAQYTTQNSSSPKLQRFAILFYIFLIFAINYFSKLIDSRRLNSVISQNISFEPVASKNAKFSFPHEQLTSKLKVTYWSTDSFASFLKEKSYLTRSNADLIKKYESIIEKQYIDFLQKKCKEQKRDKNAAHCIKLKKYLSDYNRHAY